MGFDPKKKRAGRRAMSAIAGLVAAATLVSPLAAYAADGGSGSGTGTDTGDGNAGGDGKVSWIYKDSYGAPTYETAVAALKAAGVSVMSGAQSKSTITQAVTNANNECVTRSRTHGDANPTCRLVGLGFVHTPDGSGDWYTGAHGSFNAKTWADAYKASGISGTTYYYQGVGYKTTDNFSDGKTNIDSLAAREMGKAPIAMVALVLNQYEPPVDYKLTVTTNQQSVAMKVGSTDAVHDTVHANRNGSGLDETLTATAILHYDGHPNGYVAAKSAAKTFTMKNTGDTRTPDFTPADLGMKHWQHGNYWFDVQVSKQGHMQAAVDTTDREAAETYTVPDVPPEKPAKKIEKGTSASRMVNRTTITSGTGRGGYEMTFKDTITPNGVNYEISGYRLIDLTDNGRDVSGEFAINWDKAANTVTAVRTADKGEMPLDHQYEFSFDVTVNKPDFSKVQDTATVMWNRIEKSTDGKEFKTWRPNPDKSWIKKANGKWAAVVDPTRSNATGADTETFLDQSEVASVVNGTIASDLIQEPTKVQLKDDWADADYIFDATGKDKIRVYQKDIATETQTSANDIANTGKDVTDQFDIVLKGTVATATAKASYLKTLKGLKSARQITMLVPGKTNYADGKGAGQVRKDFGKAAGDELTFCANPGRDQQLTNAGSETVNDHEIATNEPYICGYVPPVKKDVVNEASQGGEQESVQGKIVFPGQKVEYQLTTHPKLPENLAYDVTDVAVTDVYDQYLTPDKQTLEVRDLSTGKTITKKQYTTKWDDESHAFVLVFDDEYVKANWGKGKDPSVLVRFEGTVSEKAPGDHKIGNEWALTLDNSITPSNRVLNVPCGDDCVPGKEDKSADMSVDIDGKTLLKGDTGNYVVTLNADKLKDTTAYKVQRLGIVDDFDDEYLAIDQDKIEVLDSKGKDVTARFNVQIKDGVAYAFAKTVDTEIPATGETVKGDPQPTDLKEYSARKLDPLKDAYIDQNLLGQKYKVILPYTVVQVKDGYSVRNTAVQITNDHEEKTNEVSNELKPINPKKDVTIKVGGDSVDGQSVYLNRKFLYRLESSIIPANRAYPQVSQWKIVDKFDLGHDKYLDNWAVYAARDVYKDGKVIAAKGDMIGGKGFDSTAFGGDLFTASYQEDGTLTVEATSLYLQLVSADNGHEAGFVAYPQMERIHIGDRIENQFTEYYNEKVLPSNTVWTRTPDMTPSLHIEKYDVKSGEKLGDRDDVKDALNMGSDGIQIAFKITNTSKVDKTTGEGAIFRAADLKLTDRTVAGEGTVTDITYPQGWESIVLKPGQSVTVTGTLKGVTANGRHTDRAKVTGTPLTSCPVQGTDDPFGTGTADATASASKTPRQVVIDGKTLCEDTKVDSNQDDWNGYRKSLAQTGASIALIALSAVVVLGGGAALLIASRRREAKAPADTEGSEE